MYEPDSPEDKLARRITSQAAQILADLPHPNFKRVIAQDISESHRMEAVDIDIGNGHEMTITIYKKTK